MSEALSIQDTTYSGTHTSQFITLSTLQLDTVDKNCIYVEDGIKKQKTIMRLDVSNIIQRRQPTPTSQGTVTVDGKVILPRDMMIYFEFNPRDYEVHWLAEELSAQLIDRQLPATAASYMVMQTLKVANSNYEQMIWRSRIAFDPQGTATDPTSKGQAAGDSAFFYFDGLITKMLSDSTVIQVANPVTLTVSNIKTAFDNSYYAVPKTLLFQYGAKGLKFHVSYYTKQLWEEYQIEQPFKGKNTTDSGDDRYKGYDVVALAGMPDNTIVVTVSRPGMDSRLWLGLNSTDDESRFKVSPLQANSEMWFVKGLMKMDTQTGWGQEIVIYTTITA